MNFFKSNAEKMQDELFKLRYTAKQLQRTAVKCEKEEKEEKNKLKKAIEKKNTDGARIYAQNAIRKKNESLNFLRLASRIDAVAARLETAVRMNQVNKSMVQITKSMDKVLDSMNVEKISKTMDTFEQQFEDLDVRSSYMEQTMDATTSLATPEEQVDGLIMQVATEHGLEVAGEFADLQVGTETQVEKEKNAEEDDLTARLNALKAAK